VLWPPRRAGVSEEGGLAVRYETPWGGKKNEKNEIAQPLQRKGKTRKEDEKTSFAPWSGTGQHQKGGRGAWEKKEIQRGVVLFLGGTGDHKKKGVEWFLEKGAESASMF